MNDIYCKFVTPTITPNDDQRRCYEFNLIINKVMMISFEAKIKTAFNFAISKFVFEILILITASSKL